VGAMGEFRFWILLDGSIVAFTCSIPLMVFLLTNTNRRRCCLYPPDSIISVE